MDAAEVMREAVLVLSERDWASSDDARSAVQAARSSLAAVGDVEPAALLGVELAAAERRAGHLENARQILSEDAARLTEHDDAGVRSRVLHDLARLEPDSARALTLAMEADTVAATLSDPRPRAVTLTLVIDCVSRAGHDGVIAPLLDMLDQVVQATGDGGARAAARLARAEYALRAGRSVDEVLEVAREAHAAALLVPGGPWVGRAALVRGAAARRAGYVLEALESLDEAEAAGVCSDRLRLELSAARLLMGDRTAAASLSALATSEFADVAAEAGLLQAEVLLDEKRMDEAGELLDTLDPLTARSGVSPMRLSAEHLSSSGHVQADVVNGAFAVALTTSVEALRARCALVRGDTGAALRIAKRLVAEGHDCRLLLADTLRCVQQPVEALETLDGVIDDAHAQGCLADELAGLLRRAPLLFDLGDIDGARQDARRAADLAGEMHAPVPQAVASAITARCLLHQDLVAEAVAELDDGLARIGRLGAPGVAAELALVRALSLAAFGHEPVGEQTTHDALERLFEAGMGRLAVAIAMAAARLRATEGHLATAALLLARARVWAAPSGMTDLVETMALDLGAELGEA